MSLKQKSVLCWSVLVNPLLCVFTEQEDYFLGKCFEAMEVDSLPSSHPVSTPVENPAQIQEMFDDVSYDKVVTLTVHLIII